MGQRQEATTIPIWRCDAAIIPGKPLLTANRRQIGKPGFERFVACDFTSTDYDAAHRHADEHAGSHWVFEFKGDSELPVRAMHGSDYGGVYVDDDPRLIRAVRGG